MLRRVFLLVFFLCLSTFAVDAAAINWFEFNVPYESLKYAMDTDIATHEQEKKLDWIEILALAASRTDGQCRLSSVKKAVKELKGDVSAEELASANPKGYRYYKTAYQAVLGGLLGNYSILVDGKQKVVYGLKAFSPIAAGYGYGHSDDFGNKRTFGFTRRHLGHDMMGQQGTPIVAVESGVVEALGWNRYGGWRIGIRSADSKRYYYYAHLQKDHPYAPGLEEGDMVQAGDLIGFMGRTGYSDKENTNNIETVHLHFGMELVFEESQKECNNEIWIDTYSIVKLLDAHRSSLHKKGDVWQRQYPFVDLDIPWLPERLKIV